MTASSGAADPRPIPIICGPTGSGKSSVAMALAQTGPYEIISADSRQLVRHLDIGTAKPSPADRAAVPHHLIDLIELGERYSAFRFIGDASRVIGEIRRRGNLPLIVGGTGLYLRALTDGVVEIEPGDMQVRLQLEAEMDSLGVEVMHERLKQVDPLEASKIHPNNRVRLLRALEIFTLTGKSKSEWHATGSHRKADCTFQYHCLNPERELLYQRINLRVEEMLRSGWFAEVERLAKAGMTDQIRRAAIIGYGQLLDVLEGKSGLEESTSTIKQETRRYAKRQVTWFSRQAGCLYYATVQELSEALVGG
ncbi:MAG: tRNA (adenosine(37)-N6)-dimethylallyltransferase MiaA [bacterium]|nr:tRNA (adenosine(37)-N6)-dimethylallyltransferase MiaA [bacterium]